MAHRISVQESIHRHLMLKNRNLLTPMNFSQSFYFLHIEIIMFLGSKVRLVRKADNLTAIYEPIV
jgi:hypothetical protein